MGRIKPFWIAIVAFTVINILAVLLNINNTIKLISIPSPYPTEVNSLGTPVEVATEFPTPTPIPVIPVVIAFQDIPRGTVIGYEHLDIVYFPYEYAPYNSFTDVSFVVGSIAASNIYREEIILPQKLVTNIRAIESIGSDVALVVDAGRVGITLYLPMQEIPQGLAQGDFVDIIMTLQFIRLDPDFQSAAPNDVTLLGENADGETVVVAEGSGRLELLPPLGEIISEPSEAQRPRQTSQRSISNARVIWVGNFPADGDIVSVVDPTPTPIPDFMTQTPPRVTPTPYPYNSLVPVTLSVSPQEAVALVWARNAEIPMTLIVNAAGNIAYTTTSPVTLEWLMENYGIYVPIEREYGLDTGAEATEQP